MPTLNTIPSKALRWQFTRASGPGGQHVNKNATAVRLTVELKKLGLSRAVVERLRNVAGKRITGADTLTIRSAEFKSQAKNRERALNRLADLIAAAKWAKKPRLPTFLSKRKKQLRIESKRKHSAKKQLRKRADID